VKKRGVFFFSVFFEKLTANPFKIYNGGSAGEIMTAMLGTPVGILRRCHHSNGQNFNEHCSIANPFFEPIPLKKSTLEILVLYTLVDPMHHCRYRMSVTLLSGDVWWLVCNLPGDVSPGKKGPKDRDPNVTLL
jgi:hypothetical protein